MGNVICVSGIDQSNEKNIPDLMDGSVLVFQRCTEVWDLGASEGTSKPMVQSVVCRAELGLAVFGKSKVDPIDVCPSSTGWGHRGVFQAVAVVG